MEKEDEFFNIKWVEELVEDEDYKTLILFEKNKTEIVGVSVIQNIDGYIYSFGIHSKHRRRGLGKYLLQCTIACIADMRHIEAWLHVNTTNKGAIKLYKNLGFKIDYAEDKNLKNFYDSDDPFGPSAHKMILDVSKRWLNFDRKVKQKWRERTSNDWHYIHRINGLLIQIEPFCN